jgi:hypothetical protein
VCGLAKRARIGRVEMERLDGPPAVSRRTIRREARKDSWVPDRHKPRSETTSLAACPTLYSSTGPSGAAVRWRRILIRRVPQASAGATDSVSGDSRQRHRDVTIPSSRVQVRRSQDEPYWRLQQRADTRQESGRVGAVENAVVATERHGH